MKLLLLLFIFSFLACKKECSERICTDGYILWGGSPAVDGIGWYFKGTMELQKPVKLKDIPSSYETDSLAVEICVLKTNEKYPCFCSQPLEVYAIKSIRKK